MSTASPHDRMRREQDGEFTLPAAEHEGEVDARELETFVLEVSAGRPRGVGDASAPKPVVEGIIDDAMPQGVAANIPSSASRHAGSANLPATEFPRARKSLRSSRRRRRDLPRVASQEARNSRRLPSWSASVVVHGALALLLSLVTITQVTPRDDMSLVMDSAAASDELPLDSLESPPAEIEDELDVEKLSDDLAEEPLTETIDPGVESVGMAAGDGIVGDLTEEVALLASGEGGTGTSYGALGGMGELFGEGRGGRGGSGGFGSGLGARPREPQFFGAKIEGQRVVFVLDNSGSMQGGRLETVCAELERCVASLDAKQEFYVIFYSDVPYPLFYPTPVDQYVRPTKRTKELLHDWLESVELCLGDSVLDALNAAASIEPDTVLLLSDGRIQGDRKMGALLAGGGDFPLHTIGIGLGGGASTSRKNLADIAAANGGEFREAAIPDEMRELARENPRPYNSEGPGQVWGRSVRGAWGRR